MKEEDREFFTGFQRKIIDGNTEYDSDDLLSDQLCGDSWQAGLEMRLARDEDLAPMVFGLATPQLIKRLFRTYNYGIVMNRPWRREKSLWNAFWD